MTLRQRILRVLAILLTALAAGGTVLVTDRLQLLELLFPETPIIQTK